VKPVAESIIAENGNSGYEWTARYDRALSLFTFLHPEPSYTFTKNSMVLKKDWKFTQDDYDKSFPADKDPVLVCYCTPKSTGWYWEVHLDTEHVYYVNDNADLSAKYSLNASKP